MEENLVYAGLIVLTAGALFGLYSFFARYRTPGDSCRYLPEINSFRVFWSFSATTRELPFSQQTGAILVKQEETREKQGLPLLGVPHI